MALRAQVLESRQKQPITASSYRRGGHERAQCSLGRGSGDPQDAAASRLVGSDLETNSLDIRIEDAVTSDIDPLQQIVDKDYRTLFKDASHCGVRIQWALDGLVRTRVELQLPAGRKRERRGLRSQMTRESAARSCVSHNPTRLSHACGGQQPSDEGTRCGFSFMSGLKHVEIREHSAGCSTAYFVDVYLET